MPAAAFKIVARYSVTEREGWQKSDIILCDLGPEASSQFATWEQTPEDGARYHGHYFQTLADGFEDFVKRSRQDMEAAIARAKSE